MSWVALALVSAAVSGLVNILDKTATHHYFRSPRTLPALIGIFQMCVGVILTLSASWPDPTVYSAVRWALISGVLWGIGSMFLLRILYSQEVSRTVPIYHTFPIYSALIAVLFLGEALSFFGWMAIFSTVFGAITLSLRRNQEYRSLFLPRSFFPLLMGSVIAAVAYVAGKLAVDDLPVLLTHGLRNVALSSVLLVGSLRSDVVREFAHLVQRRSPAFIIVGFNEVVLASVSNIAIIWALSLGPVSLVSALIASRSLFVVLYSTIAAMRFRGFLGEDISGGTVIIKVVATTLIVAGVIGITLGRT